MSRTSLTLHAYFHKPRKARRRTLAARFWGGAAAVQGGFCRISLAFPAFRRTRLLSLLGRVASPTPEPLIAFKQYLHQRTQWCSSSSNITIPVHAVPGRYWP